MERFLQITEKVLSFLLKTMWIFLLILIVIGYFNKSIILLSVTTILVCMYFICFIVYSIVCKKFGCLFGGIFAFFLLIFLSCFYAFILNDSILIRGYYKIKGTCPIGYDYSDIGPTCIGDSEFKIGNSVILSMYYGIFGSCPFGYNYNERYGPICKSTMQVKLSSANEYYKKAANEKCDEWGGKLSTKGEYFICTFKDGSYRKFKNAVGRFNYIQVDKDGNEMEYICSGWYDGCNSCGIRGICSQQYCSEYGQSRCDSWTSREELDKEGGYLPFYVSY